MSVATIYKSCLTHLILYWLTGLTLLDDLAVSCGSTRHIWNISQTDLSHIFLVLLSFSLSFSFILVTNCLDSLYRQHLPHVSPWSGKTLSSNLLPPNIPIGWIAAVYLGYGGLHTISDHLFRHGLGVRMYPCKGCLHT